MEDGTPKLPLISIPYVADEPALLETCKLHLQRYPGITITPCENAMDAIRHPGMRTFAALVPDYEMPEVDGFKLLKTLRNEGKICTGSVMTGSGFWMISIFRIPQHPGWSS